MSDNGAKLIATLAAMAHVGLMTAVADDAGVLSATFAAWVQAIGSIAAIFGAGFIADRQNRLERAREERNRQELAANRRSEIEDLHKIAASTLQIAWIRLSAFGEALHAEQAESIGRLSIGRLETALALADRFDPFELQRPASVYAYAQGCSVLHDIVRHCRNQEEAASKLLSQKDRSAAISRLSVDVASASETLKEYAEKVEAGGNLKNDPPPDVVR